jgi:hypothetical protein
MSGTMKLKRQIADGVGQKDHDENEARRHRAEVDTASHAVEDAVKIRQNEHYRKQS